MYKHINEYIICLKYTKCAFPSINIKYQLDCRENISGLHNIRIIQRYKKKMIAVDWLPKY